MSKQLTLPTESVEELQAASEIMRALAHPLRLKMLHFMDEKGASCVNDIFEAMGIEQSIASQHLRILRQTGLVFTRREQKFVYYSVNYAKVDLAGKTAVIIATFVE
jgi:ArsR family transcriptional regulator